MIILLLGFCGPPKPEFLPEEPEKPPPTVEEIRAQLADKDPYTRGMAAAQALTYQMKELTPDLLKILKDDPAENARAAAALTLASFKEKRAAPYIMEMLRQNQGQKDLMVEALGEVGGPREASFLVSYLKDPDSTTRYKAAEALRKMRSSYLGDEVLAQARAQKDTDILQSHILALGWLGYRPAEGFLLEKLRENPRSSLAATAINALGDIKSFQAARFLLPFLREGEAWALLRDNAVEALRKIPSKEIAKSLALEIEGDNPTAAQLAVAVLEEYPSPMVIPLARQLIKKGKNIQGKAAYLLGRHKDIAYREVIEKVLQDQEVPERELAAKGLGYMQSKESIPVLREVAREKQGKARYLAVWALGVMGAQDALPEIRAALRSDDRTLVAYALEALAVMATTEDIPTLRAHLFDDKGQPLLAASALAKIQGQEALNVLLDAATSSKVAVRNAAYEGLSQRQDWGALPFLIERLEKGSAEEGRLSMAALRNITGEKFDSAAKWINWYRRKYPKGETQ
ncbi:MAG: HEAT repeat domain-containing protein [Leptospiraceae bacterium]|nr:HEAT repeat domain-containing protein [Leptospiraceae bacterium]MDW8307410.1 HEAT repeat domain-containing protein [Leptospiraceae bacterium]